MPLRAARGEAESLPSFISEPRVWSLSSLRWWQLQLQQQLRSLLAQHQPGSCSALFSGMPAKKTEKGKGGMPIRIGDTSSGWVHEVPVDGQGAIGTIVKKLNVSWDEATKLLGANYGDLNKVLQDAGVRIAIKHVCGRTRHPREHFVVQHLITADWSRGGVPAEVNCEKRRRGW